MALSVNITPSGYYSASVSATLPDGISQWQAKRTLVISYSGGGSSGSISLQSQETGGAIGHWSGSITGLQDGTRYTWQALVYDGLTYTDSGAFTTPAVPPPPPPTGPYIWNGSEWKEATPYIWTGSAWARATANIWDGSAWQS